MIKRQGEVEGHGENEKDCRKWLQPIDRRGDDGLAQRDLERTTVSRGWMHSHAERFNLSASARPSRSEVKNEARMKGALIGVLGRR